MKRKLLFIFTLLIALSFISLPLIAQDSTNTGINNLPPEPDNSGSKIVTPLSRLEFTLSITVLAFGLLIILFDE